MDAPETVDVEEVIARAVETLTAFTIPLYRDVYGKPDLCGTGFFVTVDGSNYLVSAAHVLDVAIEDRLFFYSSPKELRHFSGRLIRRDYKTSRKDDLVDVGVLRLTGKAQPPYADVRRFPMSVDYLQPSRLPRSGKHYVIIGYPYSKNRFNVAQQQVVAAPFAYRSDSIPEERYSTYGVKPESHLVLPLDRRSGVDADGRAITFPKPAGMSGSPVVELFGDGAGDTRVFPVVAVGIEYREKVGVLIATDVRYVIEAIEAAA